MKITLILGAICYKIREQTKFPPSMIWNLVVLESKNNFILFNFLIQNIFNIINDFLLLLIHQTNVFLLESKLFFGFMIKKISLFFSRNL